MEYSPVACLRQSSRCCPTDSSGLLAVQFLPGAGIWDEPCQPVEFRHDQRVPFAHSSQGQYYRMAGLNLLAAIVIH